MRRETGTTTRGYGAPRPRSGLMLPTICILAGGVGKRLGERTARTPKPLLDVAGEPFVFHQLRLLAEHGAERVVLCVGYLGEMIEERVGRTRYGMAIDYSYDSPQLDGTLGAIRRAVPLLGDRFLVLYGDTYLRLDYRAAVADWIKSDAPALMTVLRNDESMGYVECRVCGPPGGRVRQVPPHPRDALDRLRAGRTYERGVACGGRTRAGPCRALSSVGADRLALRVPGDRTLLRDRNVGGAGGDE